MSKSYAKYKTCGIAYGNNTPWYEERRRRIRRINNHRIRNILANRNLEDFDDYFSPFILPKKDGWDEPTDGTVKISANDFKRCRCFNVYITKNKKVKK